MYVEYGYYYGRGNPSNTSGLEKEWKWEKRFVANERNVAGSILKGHTHYRMKTSEIEAWSNPIKLTPSKIVDFNIIEREKTEIYNKYGLNLLLDDGTIIESKDDIMTYNGKDGKDGENPIDTSKDVNWFNTETDLIENTNYENGYYYGIFSTRNVYIYDSNSNEGLNPSNNPSNYGRYVYIYNMTSDISTITSIIDTIIGKGSNGQYLKTNSSGNYEWSSDLKDISFQTTITPQSKRITKILNENRSTHIDIMGIDTISFELKTDTTIYDAITNMRLGINDTVLNKYTFFSFQKDLMLFSMNNKAIYDVMHNVGIRTFVNNYTSNGNYIYFTSNESLPNSIQEGDARISRTGYEKKVGSNWVPFYDLTGYSPGGNIGSIQYNDNAKFNGISGFSYDKTTGKLTYGNNDEWLTEYNHDGILAKRLINTNDYKYGQLTDVLNIRSLTNSPYIMNNITVNADYLIKENYTTSGNTTHNIRFDKTTKGVHDIYFPSDSGTIALLSNIKPAGGNNEIQLNINGNFDSYSGFRFDKINKELTLDNLLSPTIKRQIVIASNSLYISTDVTGVGTVEKHLFYSTGLGFISNANSIQLQYPTGFTGNHYLSIPAQDGSLAVVVGNNSEILFNNNGVSGASSNFTFDYIVNKMYLNGVLDIPNTSTSGYGTITKNGNRFLHNFSHPTGSTAIPSGNNLFLGLNAGNFTMGSTATIESQAANNIGVGSSTLRQLTTGAQNIALGTSTLRLVTTGDDNVGVGTYALLSLSTGSRNIAIGSSAGYSMSTGSHNIAIGFSALRVITASIENTVIGSNAGLYIADGATYFTNGSRNTYIGAEVRASANGVSNENVLGYNAIGKGSNTFTFGTSSITKNVFYGAMHINGTANPPTASEGMVYYNTTDKHFYGYNGTTWKQLDN